VTRIAATPPPPQLENSRSQIEEGRDKYKSEIKLQSWRERVRLLRLQFNKQQQQIRQGDMNWRYMFIYLLKCPWKVFA
jgi:hypothetical protein